MRVSTEKTIEIYERALLIVMRLNESMQCITSGTKQKRDVAAR